MPSGWPWTKNNPSAPQGLGIHPEVGVDNPMAASYVVFEKKGLTIRMAIAERENTLSRSI